MIADDDDLMYDSQQERGDRICNDLQLQGFNASWSINGCGELFLLVDGELMRCIGQRDDEPRPYWIAVMPTARGLIDRQFGHHPYWHRPYIEFVPKGTLFMAMKEPI